MNNIYGSDPPPDLDKILDDDKYLISDENSDPMLVKNLLKGMLKITPSERSTPEELLNLIRNTIKPTLTKY